MEKILDRRNYDSDFPRGDRPGGELPGETFLRKLGEYHELRAAEAGVLEVRSDIREEVGRI